MTVVPHSPESAESSMMNTSAAGVQKGLLEVVQLAYLKRIGRMIIVLQSSKAQQSLHHWHLWAKADLWSERHSAVKEKIGKSHQVLQDEHGARRDETRRAWNTDREKLLDNIGYPMEDHIAVLPDEVHQLRSLDNKYRDQLNQVQQDHLQSSEFLHGHCQQLDKECTSKLQAIALSGLGKDLASRHETSKSAMGRNWLLEDIQAGLLQWSFTRPPEDCMVPFPQLVAMEKQREELAKTCRLMLEYTDKLPRWGQLASVRQGRPSFKRQSNASIQLLKCALRRVQVRHCLQPAFHRILEEALQPRKVNVGRQAWQKASAAVLKSIHEDRDKVREEEVVAPVALPRDPQERTRIASGNISHQRERKRSPYTSTEMHTSTEMREQLTSTQDSGLTPTISPRISPRAPSYDAAVQNMHRRQNRSGAFMLGDDESIPLHRPSQPFLSPRSTFTPRSSTLGADSQGVRTMPGIDHSPEVLHWAGEAQGDFVSGSSASCKFDAPSSDEDEEEEEEQQVKKVPENTVHQPTEPVKARSFSVASTARPSLGEASLPPMPPVPSEGERDGGALPEASIADRSVPAYMPVHASTATAPPQVTRTLTGTTDSSSSSSSSDSDPAVASDGHIEA